MHGKIKKRIIVSAVVVALLAANMLMGSRVYAHWLVNRYGQSYHWNRYGTSVTIYVNNSSNTGSNWTNADQARAEWSADTILNLPNTSVDETDINVWDENAGDTGWWGIANFWVASDGVHITHAHTRLNTYYSLTNAQKRAIYCQEIGHDFGLAHSNDGGCMGYTYYHMNTTGVVQHNITDIYNQYRYNN